MRYLDFAVKKPSILEKKIYIINNQLLEKIKQIDKVEKI